jgi:hypothetical protein
MANPPKKIILRSDAPCPCGSGRPIADCHLDIDGRLRKPRRSLQPPRPVTGFSHRSCYLRNTCDCSAQISREHYISRSVLQQIGAAVRVSGAPWLTPGEALETAIDNLTAKILCKRHNEALSPLDAEAANFFSILTNALIDLRRKTLSRKPIFHLVSGDELELWMLKVACGLYFAVGATGGVRLTEKYTIDLLKVQRAFFEGEWDTRAGLYFRGAPGDRINVKDEIGFAPLTMDDPERRFGGATVSLRGFMLELIFDTKNTNAGVWAGLVRRPSELLLKNNRRRHSIILTWPQGTPEAGVSVTELARPNMQTS